MYIGFKGGQLFFRKPFNAGFEYDGFDSDSGFLDLLESQAAHVHQPGYGFAQPGRVQLPDKNPAVRPLLDGDVPRFFQDAQRLLTDIRPVWNCLARSLSDGSLSFGCRAPE